MTLTPLVCYQDLYIPADRGSKYKVDYIRSFFAYSCKGPIVVVPHAILLKVSGPNIPLFFAFCIASILNNKLQKNSDIVQFNPRPKMGPLSAGLTQIFGYYT